MAKEGHKGKSVIAEAMEKGQNEENSNIAKGMEEERTEEKLNAEPKSKEKPKSNETLNAPKNFNTIQKSFDNVGVYRHQAFEKHSISFKSSVILAVLTQNIIFAVMFFLFDDKTFHELSDGYYYAATLLLDFVFLAEFVRKTAKTYELMKNFETTIQKRCENPSLKPMYQKMNEEIEMRTKLLYFASLKITLPTVMIPNLLVSYFKYFISDLGPDSFRLAFPTWFPFEWRSPFGYLIAFSIQFVSVYCLTSSALCFFNLLIGSCEILRTLSKDVKKELCALDDANKINENTANVKQKMCEFIDVHSDLRKLAHDYTEVNDINITACFLWTISTICSALLLVQMESDSGHLIEMIRPLVLMFWSFFLNFMLCNFAEQVSNRLGEINDAIYQCDWYTYPIDLQKMMLTIMTATQQPIFIRGFGNISATRHTFEQTVNRGYNFFTVLRRFND